MGSDEVCLHLMPILLFELWQGNAIESQGEGGFAGKRLIMLAKPFHKKWPETLLRRYVHVHDPHYWEDEYNCLWHKHCLASAWQSGRGCGNPPPDQNP